MIRQMQNKPCVRSLIIAAMIVAALVLCCAPASAFADDAELDQLQAQIESTARDYDAAVSQKAQLDEQIAQNQERIDQINEQLPQQQERSSEAVKTLYLLQQEGFSLLSAVLSSENINDFFTRLEYVDRIQQHNTEQLNKLNSMKDDLETTQANLDKAEKDAVQEADRASRAMEQAKVAREEAQQRAAAEAAAQAAQAQAMAEAAAAQANQAAGTDSLNGQSQVATGDSGSVSESVGSSDVNWSTDKSAFVSEWGSRIDSYLSSNGSPMTGHGSTFAEAAWDYGVDPRWSPAISYAESSCGLYCFLPCNAWGWGSSSWGSWDEAINSHVSGLARGYGSTLTYEAALKYCPPNANHWYNTVLAQMNNI